MGLRLDEDLRRGVDALEPELRAAAEALGMGLRARLVELRPGLARRPGGDGAEEAPDALLTALELERESTPDTLSLAACLAAHRAYVNARGQPDGVSLGALALARLLVWAQRAALLGPAPKLVWMGPPTRAPELGPGQHALGARCAARVGDTEREARALVVVSR